MLVNRILDVQDGDTLTAVQRFLRRVLEEPSIDRLFAPAEIERGQPAYPAVITEPDAISSVNPLLPVMLQNAATALRLVLAAEPECHFAAVLRPCEIRAVIELAKREVIDLSRLTIIGVDCLATHDAGFYSDVSDVHHDAPYWLMKQSLRHAHRVQFAPYRYRAACQFCDRPSADHEAADVLIGLLGVNTQEKVLILAEEQADKRLKLHTMTDREATAPEVVTREVAIWKLAKVRQVMADRRLRETGLLGGDQEVVADYLSACTSCGDCLDACPLCGEAITAEVRSGAVSILEAIINNTDRLMSCAGCGMCQAACPEDIPLAAISYALARPVQAQHHYQPGHSMKEAIPL